MGALPSKCSRCGAPINWDESASSVSCEFCGHLNTLNTKPFTLTPISRQLKKTFDPVKKALGKNLQTLVKKQNVLSDEQVNKIRKGLKILYKNNILMILIIGFPATFITSK